jgi:hypothetical protein
MLVDQSHRSIPLENGCWEYQGHIRKKDGYGAASQSNGDGTYRQVLAHTLYYETFIGLVPDGKILHHTCENRSCVNPKHLKPVTRPEHRQEHTDQDKFPCGHPRIEENITRAYRKYVRCRECGLEKCRKYRETHNATLKRRKHR